MRSRSHRRAQVLALVAGLSFVIAVTAVFLLKADYSDVEYWKKLGYPGVFVLSILGSGALIFPLPGLVAVCGASGLALNPIVVALLGGIGETLGEMSGYAIGFGGRGAVDQRPLYHKVQRWMQRRGSLVLFLVSLIPNPIFDVVGVAAGGTNFPLPRFLTAVLLGKTLKSLIVAYACLYGVELLP